MTDMTIEQADNPEASIPVVEDPKQFFEGFYHSRWFREGMDEFFRGKNLAFGTKESVLI